MIAHRRRRDPFPGPRLEPFFLQQPHHARAAHPDRRRDQIRVQARTARTMVALVTRRAPPHAPPTLARRRRQFPPPPPGLEATARHASTPTVPRDRVCGLRRGDDPHRLGFATKAGAVFSLSRSSCRRRGAFRSPVSSSRSAVVSRREGAPLPGAAIGTRLVDPMPERRLRQIEVSRRRGHGSSLPRGPLAPRPPATRH